MGLGGDDRTYNVIRVSGQSCFGHSFVLTTRQRGVRSILDKSGLDYRVRWDCQAVDTIAKIFKVVSTYTFLKCKYTRNLPLVTTGLPEVPVSRELHPKLAYEGACQELT